MRISHYDLFLNMMLGTSTLEEAKRFLDIAGVRFMISSYKVNDHDFNLRESIDINGKKAYLYEYTRNTRRFYLFGKIHRVGSDQEMVTKMLDKNVDLRKELIILSKGKESNSQLNKESGEAKLLSYRPNKVLFEVDLNNVAFLYLSDTYYPGWRAYVDGKETKIYRANLAFRAIEVPKGKHTVVFKYVPMSFYIGLVLTLLGIVLCVWLWRRDRKALPVHESDERPDASDNKGGGT